MKKIRHFTEQDKSLLKRKRADQKLSELESELHLLVQAVSGIYFRMGSDGTVLSSRIAFSSPLRFFPPSAEGRRIQDILPSDIARQLLDGGVQVHRDQTSIQFDITIEVDGKSQDFEARLFPFIKNQVMVLICGIQEPKQTNEWLAVNRRLVLLGQMAAGAAHELNNPLSIILGFAQSLILHPHDANAQLSSLKSIEHEALRCKRLVQDLLIFSRFPKPRKTSEDLITVLQGALTLIEAQARIRNVGVMADFALTVPPAVVDRQRIQQLVVNLCINAIDAMPQGGTLTVGLRNVLNTSGVRCIELYVKDTGVGISAEDQEKIFEPFFTTKEPEKGTGLGLSLVRDIVKEHQGSIRVCTEMNKGTTFLIQIPAEIDSTQKYSESQSSPASEDVTSEKMS